jgi:hypothetical protein
MASRSQAVSDQGKEFTPAYDELRRQRRELPWVKMTSPNERRALRKGDARPLLFDPMLRGFLRVTVPKPLSAMS